MPLGDVFSACDTAKKESAAVPECAGTASEEFLRSDLEEKYILQAVFSGEKSRRGKAAGRIGGRNEG